MKFWSIVDLNKLVVSAYHFVTYYEGLWSPWEFDLQWRPRGGEIDIWKPENVKFPVGCPAPPILGQTIDRCIIHEYKIKVHHIYHLFGTCKIWISPLQFPADSDFPHSKVKCIHLGINLFKMYSMDTRKLAIFTRDKEKRRTSILSVRL